MTHSFPSCVVRLLMVTERARAREAFVLTQPVKFRKVPALM
jgi:hypothetical protein